MRYLLLTILLLGVAMPLSAQEGNRLLTAETLRCDLADGVYATWEEGRPTIEASDWADDPVIFDTIDIQEGTARKIGNNGAGDVRVIETSVGLTFIEATGLGLAFTTVFSLPLDEAGLELPSVTSRHFDLVGSPRPSHYHGSCQIL